MKKLTATLTIMLWAVVAWAQDTAAGQAMADTAAIAQHEVAAELDAEEPQAQPESAQPAAEQRQAPATITSLMAMSNAAVAPLQQASTETTASLGVKPYKFWDDVTVTGLPLFAAGLIVRGERKSFRQDYVNTSARSRLIKYNFHNEIDNFTQFAPFALSTGLKVFGVEGRSGWGRYAAASAMSYAIMAAIVNPIKYSVKTMRPDGSTRNSFPSGHTATAFAAATILHKEYGLTRSPWYSAAGYAVATGTGIMRVLNNRHWVSDVFAGAGIGILSTELAYGITDLIFKHRGLVRGDRYTDVNLIENPSFFGLQMGMGFGNKNLDFNLFDYWNDTYRPINLKFQVSTAVGVEGAYFINKWLGFGGRLRVYSSPIKGWSQFMQEGNEYFDELVKQDDDLLKTVENYELTIESDHITDFSADLGLYFNWPLSKQFAVGSKALVGRSITQDLDINATVKGHKLDIVTSPELDLVPGDPYEHKWDFVTLSSSNAFHWGTGLSLTYGYKSSFSWKVFVDYDYARRTYTLDYNPYGYAPVALESTLKYLGGDMEKLYEPGGDMHPVDSTRKSVHHWVVGGSFNISF